MWRYLLVAAALAGYLVSFITAKVVRRWATIDGFWRGVESGVNHPSQLWRYVGQTAEVLYIHPRLDVALVRLENSGKVITLWHFDLGRPHGPYRAVVAGDRIEFRPDRTDSAVGIVNLTEQEQLAQLA